LDLESKGPPLGVLNTPKFGQVWAPPNRGKWLGSRVREGYSFWAARTCGPARLIPPCLAALGWALGWAGMDWRLWAGIGNNV
jgi:hypothetical protein